MHRREVIAELEQKLAGRFLVRPERAI